jgi:hypothetical protein
MRQLHRLPAGGLAVAVVWVLTLRGATGEIPGGFVSLFNGKDFTGWKIPKGDNGHWKIVQGVIDYDARSEAKGERSLWTEKSFKDFVLRVDWRFKTDEKGFMNKVPIILPDGSHKKDENGKEIRVELEDVDSGIYLRGSPDAQVNIWMWPVGSGELWSVRTNRKLPAAARAAATPKKKADRPRGEWNTFEITMKGDRVWVKLNGDEVITGAEIPGVPREGPIALQHHGGFNAKTGRWTGPPSLIQFRNIAIRELKD